MFSGIELVVVRKLKNPNTNFSSILNTDSSDGNFNGCTIVRRLPVLINQPVNVTETKLIEFTLISVRCLRTF